MTEPQLVRKAKKALEKEGHYVAKIHGGRFSVGIPDILGCEYEDGTFVGLEFKLPGKERNVTELQKSNIEGIREANGVAWVVSSVDAAVEVFRLLPVPNNGELIYECD